MAKAALTKKLRERCLEFADVEVAIEVPIPEVKRQADILITYPMGWRVAHEIQLSSITVKELEKRTNDYIRAGIDVIWWFGGKANTHANQIWCVQNFGICFHVGFHETEIEIDDEDYG